MPSRPLPPDPGKPREALFATTTSLALAAKTIHLLQNHMPGEVFERVVNDLSSAWHTLHWWQVERDLEHLLATPRWSHPVQALTLPCSGYDDLLHLCEKRLVAQGANPESVLAATRDKLKKAIALDRRAAARREARRRRQSVPRNKP